jgi:hypothetical protein
MGHKYMDSLVVMLDWLALLVGLVLLVVLEQLVVLELLDHRMWDSLDRLLDVVFVDGRNIVGSIHVDVHNVVYCN